jgi:hypothetical protein
MSIENEKDALFIAWSADREQNKPKSLKEWIREYPKFAEELLLWSADEPVFRVAEPRGAYTVTEERVLAIGRELLTTRKTLMMGTATAFAGIVPAAKEKGLSVRTLAKQVGIGVTFIAKLQDRLLVPGSVPETLLNRLGEALDVSVEQLRAYLQRPPQMATGAMYRADDVPQVGTQQSFSSALKECYEMSEEEKAFWRKAK